MLFKETAILLAFFLACSCGPAEAQALRSDQYLPGPPGCYAKTAAGVRVCEQQERLRAEQQKNYERLRVEQQKRDEQIRIQQEARKLQEQKQQEEREAEYARQRAKNDRIIREREEQEKIIKARFLEEYEASKSTYQKDIIAQVLNYSSTGNEYGREHQFWRQKIAPCTYELMSYSPKWVEETVNNLKGLGFLSDVPRGLDLNTLNPNEITFQSFGRDPLQPERLQERFSVEHQGKTLIVGGNGTRQLERIQRGWTLIFKQCPGVKKPF